MIQIFLVISIDFVFDQVATLAGPGVLGEVYMCAVCQCSLWKKQKKQLPNQVTTAGLKSKVFACFQPTNLIQFHPKLLLQGLVCDKAGPWRNLLKPLIN